MAKPYQIGDQPVPGYELLSHLGEGGFGTVWKAKGPGGMLCALKIISLTRQQGFKELRSLRLIMNVRHPNLAAVYGFWVKDSTGEFLDSADALRASTQGQQAADAEDVRGTLETSFDRTDSQAEELIIAIGLGECTLMQRLQEYQQQGLDGIPEDELLHFMEGAAHAIDFLNKPCHDLGEGPVAIQHCDIKPDNMLIVGDSIQVCDFGLATVVLEDSRATSTPNMSVAYVAPEYAREYRPSDSSDQYSLAISYYELKTGDLPYAAAAMQSPWAVIDAGQKGELDFSRVSEPEQQILRRATTLDPDDRFPSNVDMIRALRRASENKLYPHTTDEEAIGGVFAPILAGLRDWRILAAAAVVLVAGLIIWGISGNGGGGEGPQVFLQAGLGALDNKNYAEALTNFDRAASNLPEDSDLFADLMVGRGRAQYYQGEFQAAVDDFQQAERKDSESISGVGEYALALVKIGQSRYREEKHAIAIEFFTAAQSRDAASIDGVRIEFADSYLSEGLRLLTDDDPQNDDQGQELLAEAQRINSGLSDSEIATIFFDEGSKAYDADELDDAIAIYEQGIGLNAGRVTDPNYLTAINARANRSFKKGEYNAAVNYLNKLLPHVELGTEQWEPLHILMARSQIAMNAPLDAIKTLDTLIQENSGSAAAYHWRGRAYEAAGNPEAASLDYREALGRFDQNDFLLSEAQQRFAGVLHRVVATKLSRDEFKHAIDLLEEAEELLPSNEQINKLHSKALTDRAKYIYDSDPSQIATALEHLDKAIELDPENGLAYSRRFSISMKSPDRKADLADITKAWELAQNPADLMLRAIYHGDQGFAELENGKPSYDAARKSFEDAIGDLEQLLQLNDAEIAGMKQNAESNLAIYQSSLADCYLNLNNIEKAIELASASIRSSPLRLDDTESLKVRLADLALTHKIRGAAYDQANDEKRAFDDDQLHYLLGQRLPEKLETPETPEAAEAYREVADIYSTTLFDEIADGEKAVELAEKALELAKKSNKSGGCELAQFEITMACALAANSQFTEAMDYVDGVTDCNDKEVVEKLRKLRNRFGIRNPTRYKESSQSSQ